MNDTIMASIAAVKSRNNAVAPKQDTFFRSNRSVAEQPVEKGNHFSDIPKVSKPRTSMLVSLDSDILRRIKAENGDPSAKIRDILRNHFKTKA